MGCDFSGVVWPNEAMVKAIIPAGQGVFLPVMDIKVKGERLGFAQLGAGGFVG